MTLMFGELAGDFVVFSNILCQVQAGVPGAQERVPAAAADFRKSSASSALRLAVIGALTVFRQQNKH